jgi:class 3 adenylate cyclase
MASARRPTISTVRCARRWSATRRSAIGSIATTSPASHCSCRCEAGATDSLACPLTVFATRHQVITFAADRAGGFAGRDIAAIGRVLPALGIVVESKALQRLTANVLDTYLGRTIGRHILNGEIGLHVGTVYYGNVGAADRLDFPAIGPAVDLVCRLESLTKRLDRPMLLSRDFSELYGRPLASLGFHPVRGLSDPEEVFGLPAMAA